MSLFGTISISLRALLADQAALETTTNNIANADTPGYSRRRVVFEEETPVFNGSQAIPRGVTVAKIESVRDRVLELRTINEVQQQSANQAIADNLQSVELLFGEDSGMIGNELNNFFNSISKLATDTGNTSLRNGVLTAANNLADAIRNTSNKLADTQQNADRSVVQTVQQINLLTAQIAQVNVQVAAKEKLGEDSGALGDQRSQLIRNLSELIDVSTIDDSTGLTLTTSNGTPLVVGDKNYTLDASLDSTGKTQIYSQGANITSTLHAGKIGGLIEVRDQRLANLISDLDTFTTGLVSAMNAAHHTGFDASGNPGGDIFTTSASFAGSAANLQVAFSDSKLVAASSDGTSGGNGNLANLLAVKDKPVANNMSPTAFYSDMVFRVGGQLQTAKSDAAAGDLIVQQLDNQRGAISGVNTDEESANLIRYQRAYQAAARVIEIASELTDVAVHLGAN